MKPKNRLLGVTIDGTSYLIGYAEDTYTPEQLATMPYRQYLQTPEWRTRRRHALEHADHRCQRCGSRYRLEVHHRTYERRGAERLDDLVVLCANCHREEHGL